MQLHIEDLEDRGCRNNVHLRGFPEQEDRENLEVAVSSVFNDLLGTNKMGTPGQSA